jgi:hypothetical protein
LAGNGGKLNCEQLKCLPTSKISISYIAESFISPPYVYYFTDVDWNDKKRELSVFSVNTNTNKTDSLVLKIPASIIINSLPKIALNENYLILTDDEKFDVYRFHKTKDTYSYVNKIKLPPYSVGGNVRWLSKNLFLLSSNYNQHPADKLFNTNLGVYDAEKDQIKKFIHPELPCIGFSHLVNSWITNNDNRIALAAPCGYKIFFYDFELNLVDSINYHPKENWEDLPGNTIPFETNPAKSNPKLIIEKLMHLEDSISRIEMIFFVNNSTLLVSSGGNGADENQRRIDLWKIGFLEKPNYTDPVKVIDYSQDDTIDVKNTPLFLLSPLNLDIKNSTLYTFNPEEFIPVKKTTANEFNLLKDQYYEKNDPHYSIQLYKINLP